jgi:C1A family cysteine protease
MYKKPTTIPLMYIRNKHTFTSMSSCRQCELKNVEHAVSIAGFDDAYHLVSESTDGLAFKV